MIKLNKKQFLAKIMELGVELNKPENTHLENSVIINDANILYDEHIRQQTTGLTKEKLKELTSP